MSEGGREGWREGGMEGWREGGMEGVVECVSVDQVSDERASD